MSFKEFKNKVFMICNELNYSVDDFHEGGVTPNFHAAHITSNDINLFVLCSYENQWAYSKFFSRNECRLEFIDFPEFSKLLNQYFEITPHKSSELYSPFTNKHNNSEDDIKYWKPQSEGDGIFNWWD